MGNKMSNPMSEESLEKVQRLITEVLEHFKTEFSLHYKDAIIANIRSKGEKEEEFRLPHFPVPDYVLKSGVMYKKGAVSCAIHGGNSTVLILAFVLLVM